MIHGRVLSSLWSSALALCHTEPGLKSDPSWHYHSPIVAYHRFVGPTD